MSPATALATNKQQQERLRELYQNKRSGFESRHYKKKQSGNMILLFPRSLITSCKKEKTGQNKTKQK